MAVEPVPDPPAEEKKDPESGIRIGDKVLEGPQSYTLTEAEYIRAHCDLTLQDIVVGSEEDPSNPDIIRAVAWVVLHRLDSKLEWDGVPADDINVADFWVVPPPPKEPSPRAGRPRKSS